jgi:hypothetical protein
MKKGGTFVQKLLHHSLLTLIQSKTLEVVRKAASPVKFNSQSILTNVVNSNDFNRNRIFRLIPSYFRLTSA